MSRFLIGSILQRAVVARECDGKKKTLERKHRVKARLQVEELAKAGSALYLDIFADEEKIGTIEIGRGSFIWWGGKRKKRRKISWSDFAELLDRYFYDQP